MKKQQCGGFTLVEMTIVAGLLAVLFILALALALLPVTTYPARDVPVAKSDIATFRDLINSDLGFGKRGGEWLGVLAAGADFVPFAVPVDYGDDGDTLDGELALELGIAFPDGREAAVGSYAERDGQNFLDGGDGCLHPTLARLAPADFGADVAAGDASPVDLSQPRFAKHPAFAPNQQGMGLLRFVALPGDADTGAEWITVDEKERAAKGNGGRWDLNDDGTTVDVYALGRLELIYMGREGETTSVPVSGDNILLQLNRDSPSWKPLFKLVRLGAGDGGGEDAAPTDTGGYALLIDLLVFDQSAQDGSPLAFNDKLPYLVRRHQTMIELRNMSNDALLSAF